jgi:hypothetical protein
MDGVVWEHNDRSGSWRTFGTTTMDAFVREAQHTVQVAGRMRDPVLVARALIPALPTAMDRTDGYGARTTEADWLLDDREDER